MTVGSANGPQIDGVVSCDNIVTVPTTAVGRHIGFLLIRVRERFGAATCTHLSWRSNRRALSLSRTLAEMVIGVTAAPALDKTPPGSSVDTSTCLDPQLSQPFGALNDTNWYALAPGQTPDNFDATGWTLSSGANLRASAEIIAGSDGGQPPVCVAANYPTARLMIQTTDTTKVAFAVSYLRRHQIRRQAPVCQHRPRPRPRQRTNSRRQLRLVGL